MSKKFLFEFIGRHGCWGKRFDSEFFCEHAAFIFRQMFYGRTLIKHPNAVFRSEFCGRIVRLLACSNGLLYKLLRISRRFTLCCILFALYIFYSYGLPKLRNFYQDYLCIVICYRSMTVIHAEIVAVVEERHPCLKMICRYAFRDTVDVSFQLAMIGVHTVDCQAISVFEPAHLVVIHNACADNIVKLVLLVC